ncbi:MAG TPA: methyltransferase domain-containing protein [Pyrinomonadaceae bacterium]|jgi:ubiquinone/menaquinone biosynthesis C-methylase UbiE
MDSNLIAFASADEQSFDNPAPLSPAERIVEFYEEASMDYRHWSKDFNMHLGFYRRGLNPFKREKMLEQLNLEIAARLYLDAKAAPFLIDLGCGAGAISRSVAKNYPRAIIKGVTLSPSQVETAEKLNAQENLQKQIEIFKGDYASLPFADGAADGVWAVESACYAEGAAKENLAREMARVLKTGGRFAVADCFIKQPGKKFNALIEKCYSELCKGWALPEMPALDYFVAALKKEGFRDIVAEDISWRVAPSLAHAPYAVLTFILKKIFAGEPLKRQSINNLKASLLAPALGLNRSKFSYCLISGARG